MGRKLCTFLQIYNHMSKNPASQLCNVTVTFIPATRYWHMLTIASLNFACLSVKPVSLFIVASIQNKFCPKCDFGRINHTFT